MPVLAGAGGYNTAEVIELAQRDQGHGRGRHSLRHAVLQQADAGRACISTIKAIAPAVKLPMIVYSVQGRTGVNVEPATLKRLSEIDYIVGVKEASGNIGQMAAVVHLVPPSFAVLSGDDAITIPLIALGGRGIVSVVSNEIPGEMTALDAARAGQRFRRRARHAAQISAADGSEFRRVEPDSGEGRAWRSWDCSNRCGGCRCVRPAPANLAKIEKVLETLGLLAGRSVHAG